MLIATIISPPTLSVVGIEEEEGRVPPPTKIVYHSF